MAINSQSLWGATGYIQTSFRVPTAILFGLLAAILLLIGWSPLNVNVLRNIFVLANSRNEAEFAKLVPPDGQSSPFIRSVMATRNVSLGDEGYDSPESNAEPAIDILRLLSVERVLQINPELFHQWTVILTFGVSVWMFGGCIAGLVCNVEKFGPSACAILGPSCFLSSMFCLLLPAPRCVPFLGISFLSELLQPCIP